MTKRVSYTVFWIGAIVMIAFLREAKHNMTLPSFITSNVGKEMPASRGGGIVFRKYEDGHFYVTAEISGVYIKFLVDTGATDVVLCEKDAQRVGAYMRPPKKTKTYHTANGSVKASYLQIPEIKINTLVARNVGASISSTPQLKTSLLGMSFLKNFHFVMQKDTLILYPD